MGSRYAFAAAVGIVIVLPRQLLLGKLVIVTPSFGKTDTCRCGPVAYPVAPLYATTSPFSTRAPVLARTSERWPNTAVRPLS